MPSRLFAAILLSISAFAANKDFNGRWDITVPSDNRGRAWWLEVKGADTPTPSASFIGAPGGDLNQPTSISIQSDELIFNFATKKYRGKPGVYKAKIVNGKLEGRLEVEGEPQPVTWTGVRAPVFKPVDISKLKEGTPIELFNGRDLSGWRTTNPSRPMEWKVENGVTKNAPGISDIVTDQKFQDFKLHAEYRVGPGSNSGIGLRARYEVQILEDFGKPVSLHGNGALYSRILPTENASKPANEWQTSDITLAGNRVTVVLNGKKIIDNKEIDGLTAVAVDPNEGEPGPIIVQGDHGAVEFRKLTLTPLVTK